MIRPLGQPKGQDGGSSPRTKIGEKILGTLEQVLAEVRQLRTDRTRKIEPKWLTVSETVAYTGMSMNWVRSLEAVAPRGLFTRLKGTVFVNRAVLDDIFEGNIELEDV